MNCEPHPYDFGVYQPRKHGKSGYFRCVETHFEDLEAVFDNRNACKYGFWRPYVVDVIYRYLNCGDLHFGFARVRCEDCGHGYLLAFSCKRRHFCPSCHQKRVVEFGEWLCTEVLKYVPHRQWVFSTPKRLRIYFMMNRKLLAKLSQCDWKVLNLYLMQAAAYDDAKAVATVAVQSFYDFQNFNPHLHVLATDGCFYGNGSFKVCPTPQAKDFEEPFRQEVFKILKAKGKITYVVSEKQI
ncbi:MAG: transposase zinc-binding domain-containing protein, partial [Deltaproteobacteria bacterium]|nr:transposase zinc-binding domain-containing protein [Deltaproteobacteria bacterium]